MLPVGYDASFVIFLSAAILGAVALLTFSMIFTNRMLNKPPSLSPYTKMPLRIASDLSFENRERVLRFLYNFHEFDNQMFNLANAAFCRETGRIFPNAVTWYGTIEVDWSFLQKRYPGKYVSWGSLSDMQKTIIIAAHHSLAGYQTEYSSPEPAPSKVAPFYVAQVPGPLYVDLDTKVLLGWKSVPLTDLEVLIVQKPKGLFELSKSMQ